MRISLHGEKRWERVRKRKESERSGEVDWWARGHQSPSKTGSGSGVERPSRGPPGPAPRAPRVCSRAGRPAAASGQSGRASGEGRGLLVRAPRVLLFAHTRIQRAIRPSGILFPFFSPSLILCVCSSFFLNRDLWQCWGEETVAKGNLRFSPFLFLSLFLFLFPGQGLNIPRSWEAGWPCTTVSRQIYRDFFLFAITF